jgi:hypothetical protein
VAELVGKCRYQHEAAPALGRSIAGRDIPLPVPVILHLDPRHSPLKAKPVNRNLAYQTIRHASLIAY